jgi:hypothetical protein
MVGMKDGLGSNLSDSASHRQDEKESQEYEKRAANGASVMNCKVQHSWLRIDHNLRHNITGRDYSQMRLNCYGRNPIND